MLLVKRRKLPKLFLDSSVVVTAVLSSSGGSFRLFREAKKQKIKLSISSIVLLEVVKVLQRKYPAALALFYKLITDTPIEIISDPSQRLVARVMKLIHPDDAPILASALKSQAKFLITLDKKDFFTQTIEQTKLPIKICTPKEFLQKYWK